MTMFQQFMIITGFLGAALGGGLNTDTARSTRSATASMGGHWYQCTCTLYSDEDGRRVGSWGPKKIHAYTRAKAVFDANNLCETSKRGDAADCKCECYS
jgi:hypothetical protein